MTQEANSVPTEINLNMELDRAQHMLVFRAIQRDLMGRTADIVDSQRSNNVGNLPSQQDLKDVEALRLIARKYIHALGLEEKMRSRPEPALYSGLLEFVPKEQIKIWAQENDPQGTEWEGTSWSRHKTAKYFYDKLQKEQASQEAKPGKETGRE